MSLMSHAHILQHFADVCNSLAIRQCKGTWIGAIMHEHGMQLGDTF